MTVDPTRFPRQTSDAALRAAFGPQAPSRGDTAPERRSSAPPDLSRWPAQADRFELEEVIAEGGFGTVLRARDKKLGREVALKTLRDDLPPDAMLLRRLVEEAQISSQLQHPGVVPVYDYGLLSEGRPYIAMKLVRGRTLREILREAKTREERHALLPICERICQTMAYVHSRGVVHRDLKPSNIMVGRFGEVQVMDWGLAKVAGAVSEPDSESHPIKTLRDEDDVVVSQYGAVFGTPAYMAPEQARGDSEQVGLRSDVFSLGAVLYETLTGRRVYDEISRTALESDTTLPDAAPWEQRLASASIDGELQSIVLACLQPAPEDRLAHAGKIAERISEYRASVDARAQALELEAAEARSRATAERRSRQLTLAFAFVVVVFVLAGAAIWGWWDDQQRQKREETAARIAAPLAQARLLYQSGVADRVIDEAHWRRAVNAAREAEAAVTAGESDADTRTEVARLTEDIRSASEAAARARRFRDQLDDAWAAHGDAAGRARTYERIFREHGFDMARQSEEELGRLIAESPIRTTISFILDDWGGLRRRALDPDWKMYSRLRNVADPDPVRLEIRNLVEKKDDAGVLERVSSIDVATADPLTLRVMEWGLEHSGHRDQRMDLLREATHLHPFDYRLRFSHGLVAALRRDWSEAAASFRAAAALRPSSYAAWANLGGALDELADPEAIRVYERALRIRDDVSEVWNNYGACLMRVGRLDDCKAALERARALDPSRHEPVTALARLAEARKRLEEAERLYRESIGLGGKVEAPLGILLAKQGRKDDAIRVWREGLVRRPDDVALLTNVGWEIYRAGEIAEGESLLQLAWDLRPGRPFPALNLARVYSHTGRVDDAIHILLEAVERFPTDPIVGRTLGEFYVELGRWADAESTFRRFLAASATPELKLGLARTLIATGRYAGALAWLKDVTVVEPRYVNLWDPVKLRSRCARLKAVADALPTHLDRLPTKPEELVDVATVLSALGWYRRAAPVWRNALESRARLSEEAIEAAAYAMLATVGDQDRGDVDRTAVRLLGSVLNRRRARAARSLAKKGVLALTLARWERRDELRSVRGDAIKSLPDDARETWIDFWTAVADAREELRPSSK